ncbi:transposase [Fluoribacter gormanii]|uniref:Transposase n=3 Tax=Fluoribacter gormanii TaxID=464 RepID=A0A377GGG5_9GAMM|nr:transposase [Fluoribacter gormanii]SIR68912.1 Transposase zinc-binding domain-containing protein [Fluoribacter gormanii]STO23653.1 Putative transposase [Fluoribacter gormanii]
MQHSHSINARARSIAPGIYERHRPEDTTLYQVISKHYADFLTYLSDVGKGLPSYVKREFEDYLKCGQLKHGFLRVRCDDCFDEKLVAFSCKHRGFCPSCGTKRMVESAALLVDGIFPDAPIRQWVLSLPYDLRFLLANNPEMITDVLKVIHRAIGSYVIKKAGLTIKTGKTGAVTLIQRFGSALNLNIHFHMLFLDGAYGLDENGDLVEFHAINKPTFEEMQIVLHRICERLGRLLEKRGLLCRDAEQSYLTFDYDNEDVINDLIGSSITYRVAVGKNKGKKVYTLQTIPAQLEDMVENKVLAKESGFSLHAGVSAKSYQKEKIERLCRYITRPAVSLKRLRLSETGKVIYELKNPYKNGTTHIVFEPLDFIARLAALVPRPWMNLTRFHGVFAPNSKYRKAVTGYDKSSVEESSATTINPNQRYRMSLAERLKRVFNMDITICQHCLGNVRIIACIKDKNVIDKILAHINKKRGN